LIDMNVKVQLTAENAEIAGKGVERGRKERKGKGSESERGKGSERGQKGVKSTFDL